MFVDRHFKPWPDQWAFMASIKTLSGKELEDALLRSGDGGHTLDVAFSSEEENGKPWQRQTTPSSQISGPLPESLTMVLSNQIFIAKTGLPQSLANRLIRLATFQNPEFYKAQSMRLPVWNKPRIIGCAENYPQHIGLPGAVSTRFWDCLSKTTSVRSFRTSAYRETGSPSRSPAPSGKTRKRHSRIF